jgi:hypothetical protein
MPQSLNLDSAISTMVLLQRQKIRLKPTFQHYIIFSFMIFAFFVDLLEMEFKPFFVFFRLYRLKLFLLSLDYPLYLKRPKTDLEKKLGCS